MGGSSWPRARTRQDCRAGNGGSCAAADIVVSDRWLPRECSARWLTIDRDSLAASGGLAIYLDGKPKAVATLSAGDGHP